jgi:hypothetical protein
MLFRVVLNMLSSIVPMDHSLALFTRPTVGAQNYMYYKQQPCRYP